MTRKIVKRSTFLIGVIDFERWRPIFRQNWGSLNIYREKSKKIEAQKFPGLNSSAIEKKATHVFEKFATSYMVGTLTLATTIRPKAKWGYYGYPNCFNFSPTNFKKECAQGVPKDNNRSTWMYKTGTALFPSIYLHKKSFSEGKRAKLIKYRVLEGLRVAKLGPSKLKVLPYAYFKYKDTADFLSQEDMYNSLFKPREVGADGVIIWGSSKDVDTHKKCFQLNKYVDKVLGPLVEGDGSDIDCDNLTQHPNEA